MGEVLKKESAKAVVVKKINAYPFAAQLVLTNPQPIPGQVLKVTNDGALVDIGTALVKVGSLGIITFRFPTFQRDLQIQFKVLKSQDRAITTTTKISQESILAQKQPNAQNNAQNAAQAAPGAHASASPKVQITRILEVRFLLLSETYKSEINQFLAIIKQV